MQTRRDSSVWKSLAAAFGDGLAFGVGVKLSQNAARRPETNSRRELAAPSPLDRKVLEAVATALEERLKEHAGQVERSMAAARHRVDEEMAGMRAELAATNGELDQLRHQVAENGAASRDLLTTVGQACLDAAARMAPPAPPNVPEPPANAVITAAAPD